MEKSDMEEWISVKEKLPSDAWRGYSDEVLVYDPEGHVKCDSNVYIAQYQEEDEAWALRDYMDRSTTVTHWCPLPQPPEK